jgi:hypothetical protein
MKIIRNILVFIAILAIISNIASYFVAFITLPKGFINKIAYLLGFNLPIFFAGILFLIVHFINKIIRRKENKKLLDSLFK